MLDLPSQPIPLEQLSEDLISSLGRRLIAAQALASLPSRTKEDVDAAASELGVHPSTIYRDLKRLKGRGTVRDLLGKKRGYPKGRSRLHWRQDEIIDLVLQNEYLSKAKASLVSITIKIGDVCEDEGLSRPTRSAVIRRLKAIPKRIVALRRSGPKAAEKHTPRPGRYEVQKPWDVWQIDHTLADVIVVDGEGRPIGRPWLTVIIDVCTRMIAAFYVGLEPPSIIRVATTLDLAVLNKAAWLTARDLDHPWPVEGLPRLMHSDRAKEFTSQNLRRAIINQGAQWKSRPRGRTHYGGHVERLIGTLMGECRLLPGATHNSPAERGNYDSKASACMSIYHLEMYFAHQILGVYHQREHSDLGMSPLEAWQSMTSGRQPDHPEDAVSFRLDLLPAFERTITRQGIKAFSDEYYSPALGEAYAAGVRRVTAKYDPRDLSRLHVKLPDGAYLDVPYRLRREKPAPSLWLLKATRKSMSSRERRDRTAVRRATEAAEAVIRAAATKSSVAARQSERLDLGRREVTKAEPTPSPRPPVAHRDMLKGRCLYSGSITLTDPDDDWESVLRGEEA
jgi:putative transposase